MAFGSSDIGMGITFTLRNRASAPAAAAGRSVRGLQRSVSASMAGINASINSLITGLAGLTIALAAVLGPFVGMVRAAASLDQELSQVAAVSRIEKNSEAFAKLREQTILLGEATVFTAKEVAEGQFFLARTGLEVNEVLAAMPGMLNLASAGNLGLARTADIASNILIAMGLEASEMTRVANVLAAASTRANVSVEQMGESFRFAAPFAQQLGVSLETTSALVGMLGDMGVQGTLAGTAFKNFASKVSRLFNNQDKMSKFGITMNDIADSAGNMKRLDVVFGNIVGKISEMGNLERVGALSELFGLRGNVAILATMSKASKDLRSFSLTLEDSIGEAARIAALKLDNLNGDLIKLGSVLNSVAVVGGENFQAPLRAITQQFIVWTKKVKELMETNIGKWIVRVTGALAGLTAVILVLGFVAAVVAPALGALFAAFVAALPVIIPVVLALGALVAVVSIAVMAVKRFKEVLSGAEKATGFVGFLQKVGGIATGVLEVFKTWNGETFALSNTLVQALERIGVLDIVLTVATWVVRFREFYNGVAEGARVVWGITKVIWANMKTAVLSLLDTIGEFIPGLSKATSELSNWERAGKIFGIVITEFILRPMNALMIVVATLATGLELILELLRDITVLGGSLFNTGGVQAGLATLFATDKAGPLAELLKASGEAFDNAIKFADSFDPFNTQGGLADQFAQNKAAGSVVPDSTVIDNTTTRTESIQVSVNLDGDQVGQAIVEKEELDDNRN